MSTKRWREAFSIEAAMNVLNIDFRRCSKTVFPDRRARKEVRIDKKDYLLIDVSPYKNICLGTQKSLKPEDVDILPGNVDILPENVDSAEQRKGKIKERKEKENKVKEISLTPFVPEASGREQWEIWKNELLEDEDWRASAVRQSGEGIGFNEMFPAS